MAQNKRRFVFNLVIILIVLIPVIMLVGWLLTPKKTTNILIVDKTVLTKDAYEHKGLIWTLKHRKYVKPDNNFYNLDEDYLGFFPKSDKQFEINDLKNLTLSQIDSISDTINMVYYTDTYGIYHNEWYSDSLQSEHSKKVYGGLDIKDYELLRKMKEKKKLILSEFNLIANPTSIAVRSKVENLFGFQWTGWTLKYFESLDTATNHELPNWVINNFMEQHNGRWPYTKSGIVFVNEDETIFIMQNEDHLKHETPIITSTTYAHEKYNIPATINYPYWIDINYVSDSVNTVLANYNINTTDDGDSLLSYYNIPSRFPAVFAHTSNYQFYYFAGDFCDNEMPMITTYFKGITWLKRWLMERSDLNNRELFFWNYYYPMIKVIMNDNYDQLKNSKKIN